MNVSTLRQHLLSRKGATFVGLTTATVVKALKKNRVTGEPNPYGIISKTSNVRGMIGFRYGNAVNNQRAREDKVSDFQPKPRQWGEHVGSCLIEHKGKTYLEVKVDGADSPTYTDENGNVLEYEQIKDLLPKRSSSNRQGTEKEIIVRDYNLDSILSIRIDGDEIHTD